MGGPSLPVDDPDPARRHRQLEWAQRRYRYSTNSENLLAPIGVATQFPLLREFWSLHWLIGILPRSILVVANLQLKVPFLRLRSLLPGYDKLAAYQELFAPVLGMARPPDYDRLDDQVFARERIDGPNPLVIERIDARADLDRRLGITDQQFSQALGQPTSLEAEIHSGNLFVCDYQLLEQSLLPARQDWAPRPLHRDSRWRKKYLPAPVALFCHRPGVLPNGWNLVPVAIRIDQADAAAPNPLYLRGAHAWELAKLYVHVADANLHEQANHNWAHHFVAGAIAATTRRQLAWVHPLHVLLEPHIAHTLMVNKVILGLLTKMGSADDHVFSGTLEEDREILREAFNRSNFRDRLVQNDVAHRKMDQYADYPWRDDARLWQPPLASFVHDYLSLFYRSDAQVAGDTELQAWFAELQAPDGGTLRGLTPNGTLQSLSALEELVAEILFRVGPGHAAVHYPLQDYLAYAPRFPRGAWQPPPFPDEIVDPGVLQQRWLDTLPPIERAADQFQVGRLSSYRFWSFGDYRAYRLGHLEKAHNAVAALRSALVQVEQTIASRNAQRVRPYTYLLPSRVPNTIHL